jgi:hypothetical protein
MFLKYLWIFHVMRIGDNGSTKFVNGFSETWNSMGEIVNLSYFILIIGHGCLTTRASQP